jgi:hypothetical protein
MAKRIHQLAVGINTSTTNIHEPHRLHHWTAVKSETPDSTS